MKIRSGFVSNSSSSSFVVVGFEVKKKDFPFEKLAINLLGVKENKIPKDPDERDDFIGDAICDAKFCIMRDSEDGAPNDNVIVIGEELASGDSYFESGSFEYKKLETKVLKLSKKLGIENPKIKIYVGTRAC